MSNKDGINDLVTLTLPLSIHTFYTPIFCKSYETRIDYSFDLHKID